MQFRLLNVPVRICPTFWVFLLFFTNLYQAFNVQNVILGCILIFSLLVHEYGHALTAKYFGAYPEITLEAFGGYARYDGYKMTRKQQFLITLNGPLLESVLIIFPYFLLKSGIFSGHYYVQYTLYVMMKLNIFWCLLNLIPLVPLDGGRIASYMLDGWLGERRRIILGLVCAVFIAPFLFFKGFFFFGTLIFIFGFRHFQMLQRAAFSKPSSFSLYLKGAEAMHQGDLESAKKLLQKLLKSKDEKIRHNAIEALAEMHYRENEAQKSYAILLKANPQLLKNGKVLLCKLAYEQENYGLVSMHSREIYEIEPSYDIAVLNSKAFACLKEPDYAGAWLRTASLFDGVSHEEITHVLEDRVYDSIRNMADFEYHVHLLTS